MGPFRIYHLIMLDCFAYMLVCFKLTAWVYGSPSNYCDCAFSRGLKRLPKNHCRCVTQLQTNTISPIL